MSRDDKGKELLERLLADLYSQQAKSGTLSKDSYLIAHDNQYLGRVTDNRYAQDSILNQYGPYGSKYSRTSIFNPYSNYGSPYGQLSVNNPYCQTPPRLVVDGSLVGYVSKNQNVNPHIPTESFIYSLEHNIGALLSGRVIGTQEEARSMQGESFIVASDGTFLGKLNPNIYDPESVFNQYSPYGNQYSPACIFNPYSLYGDQFSITSPFNALSLSPPKIYLKGQFIAYLTINGNLNPRLDPNQLLRWAEENVPQYS